MAFTISTNRGGIRGRSFSNRSTRDGQNISYIDAGYDRIAAHAGPMFEKEEKKASGAHLAHPTGNRDARRQNEATLSRFDEMTMNIVHR